MWRLVPAERDERHVLLARASDSAAAHDAVGVGDQHHLQEHGRRIGRRSGRVIPKACVEVRQVDGVIEEIVDRMLDRAGQQLAPEIDGEQLRVGGDGLVASHGRKRGRSQHGPSIPQPAEPFRRHDHFESFSTASLATVLKVKQ